jgi:hypothetical protein
MAFTQEMKDYVISYVESDLRPDEHKQYFWFISDTGLRGRLEEEFQSARYIYKLLEGLRATDWLQAAQVRVQILMYASIYEAILHHVLLNEYKTTAEVIELTSYEHRRPINISGTIRKKLLIPISLQVR